MIGPGWMPAWPRRKQRRTFAYTPKRRARVARTPRRVNHEVMMFDAPRELPVATVRRAPGSLAARLAGSLAHWLSDRWSWLRPRTIPVLVAAIGMVAVLNAVNYLAKPPAPAISMTDGASLPAPQPAYGFHIRVVLQQ